MAAFDQLEEYAIKYANNAIQADRQGSTALAINQYRRATEVLLRLCALYPNAPQNRVYMERAEAYRKRVKELEEAQKNASDALRKPGGASKEPLVLTDKPAVKWDDIADLNDAKKAIQDSIIFPAKRPDLFPLGWPRGILLFGPPGCGKTLVAAAVATEIEASFYCVDAHAIMSKWLGESEKNVAQLFENAREASKSGKPAIIFIDEIDSIIGLRTEEVGGEVRVRNQFLKEMDSVADKNKPLLIYVIGATNKPWTLDEAFIRRFQKRIYIPPPDLKARLEMMKIYARNLTLAEDVDLHQLSALTEGYSGSDIRDVFQAVQIRVVREFFEASGKGSGREKPRPITMADFRDVLRERKPSIPRETLQHYSAWFNEFKAL